MPCSPIPDWVCEAWPPHGMFTDAHMCKRPWCHDGPHKCPCGIEWNDREEGAA